MLPRIARVYLRDSHVMDDPESIFFDLVLQIAGIFRTVLKGSGTPKIPGSLSEEGKDFLKHCLERDPACRYSATQLLNHRFIRS